MPKRSPVCAIVSPAQEKCVWKCPICLKTQDMAVSEWGQSVVCMNPPCIYQRTLEKTQQAKQAAPIVPFERKSA